MIHIGIAVSIFILTVLFVGGAYAYYSEKKNWNGGYCSRCGEKWNHFDNDSQGGRGYNCGCRHIWISYAVDHYQDY